MRWAFSFWAVLFYTLAFDALFSDAKPGLQFVLVCLGFFGAAGLFAWCAWGEVDKL